MRNVILFQLSLILVATLGCASGDVDLLEARLRSKDAELRTLANQLESTEQRLAYSKREIRSLQQQLAGQTPEVTSQLARIESLSINERLTGGLDEDGRPGDDVLNVVIAPVDASGEVVRMEGEIEIEAIDPSLPESNRKLGEWKIPLAEAAEKWHDGFLGKGYQLTEPWQKKPLSEKVVLLARYRAPDGRQFSASHNIKVAPAKSVSKTPDLLPLPQAKVIKPATSPVIQTASFDREDSSARPFPMVAPKIAPRSKDSFQQDPNPLPADTGSQPIPLEELLNSNSTRETPPFAE